MYYAILSDWDEPSAPSRRVCIPDNPKKTALEEAINNLLNLFVLNRFALFDQLPSIHL